MRHSRAIHRSNTNTYLSAKVGEDVGKLGSVVLRTNSRCLLRGLYMLSRLLDSYLAWVQL